MILKVLTWKLVPKVDDTLKAEIVKWSAFYEHRVRMGSKVIFHLEAFVAKVMRILERFVNCCLNQIRLTFSSYLMNMDF